MRGPTDRLSLSRSAERICGRGHGSDPRPSLRERRLADFTEVTVVDFLDRRERSKSTPVAPPLKALAGVKQHGRREKDGNDNQRSPLDGFPREPGLEKSRGRGDTSDNTDHDGKWDPRPASPA